MNDSKDKIDLRRVTTEDHEFLLGVYEASREIELSMLAWDAERRRSFAEHQLGAQTRHYESQYQETRHEIVIYNGEPVGRLFVSRGDPAQIAILDITILPKYGKKGIGTHLVNALKDEALNSDRSLRIFIEDFNPSQILFRKLGFQSVEGETVNLRFEWHKQTAAP